MLLRLNRLGIVGLWSNGCVFYFACCGWPSLRRRDKELQAAQRVLGRFNECGCYALVTRVLKFLVVL